MDPELKALLEKRETMIKEQADLLGKGAALTQEDFIKATEINGELGGIDEKIEQFKSVADMQAKNAARQAEAVKATEAGRHTTSIPGVGNMIHVEKAGEAQITRQKRGGLHVESVGPGLLSEKQLAAIGQPEYADLFWKHYLRGDWANMNNVDQKLLQEGADASGGFLVPEDFMNMVIMKKPTPTRIAGYCSSFNTSRDALTIPRLVYATDDNYTSGMRVTNSGEVPATAASIKATDPVWGQIRIPVFTFMISMPVTNDMIEDSAVALQPFLEDKFAETIELLYDNQILNGLGINAPFGILGNPGATDQPAVVVSGNASALTGDGLLSTAWSVPEQYEENLRWVFNKTNTGQAVAKLKDGQGRYLWGNGLQDSGLSPSIRDRQLAGYPVNFSGFMPNVGANAYPAIFGDFGGYFLVRRVGLSIQILREVYAETNQIMIVGRIRFGGQVAEPWRMKIHQVHS